MIIRSYEAADALAVAAIYNYYIEHTIVTFEEVPITPAEMQERIAAVQVTGFPWVVALVDAAVVGYAYAAQWKNRSGYRYAAEISVYLAPDQAGKGLGSALYAEIFAGLRAKQMHTVMAGIALPNAGSVALHEKFAMQKVAHFAQVGFKFGQWIDVGYWQVFL